MIVGFTGTRRGCKLAQLVVLRDVLIELQKKATGPCELHHGVAVGADAEAHVLVERMEWTIVGHPASDLPGFRSTVIPHVMYDPLPPLERNRNIVRRCEILIACPEQAEEQLRSGTWSTVRFAKRAPKPLIIIFPDGTQRRYFIPD